MIAQPDTSRPLPQPERHWCHGCWAEMSPGSTGKCQPCLDWLSRGPSDDEANSWHRLFPHDWAAPIRAADRQYHGDGYLP